MVTNVDSDWLPRAGEAVLVAWGLEQVTGHVLDAYASGSRPRAVVAIDAGQVGDDEITVTLPLDALQPLNDSSTWARALKYERSLLATLSRVLGETASRVERGPSGSPEPDMVVRLASGRALVIDAKSPAATALSAQEVNRSIARLANYLGKDSQSLGLLVLGRSPGATIDAPQRDDIAVAIWRDQRDDGALTDALGQLLLAEGVEAMNAVSIILQDVANRSEQLGQQFSSFANTAAGEDVAEMRKLWRKMTPALQVAATQLEEACDLLLMKLNKADAMVSYMLRRAELGEADSDEARAFLSDARESVAGVPKDLVDISEVADALSPLKEMDPDLWKAIQTWHRGMRKMAKGLELVASWVPRIDAVLANGSRRHA